MSYILDALRRADAEREAGTVPGLHTLGSARDGEGPSARRTPPWAWLGVLLAGVLAVTLAWVLLGRDTPAEVPATAALPAAPPAPPPPIAAAAPAPVPATAAAPTIAATPKAPQRSAVPAHAPAPSAHATAAQAATAASGPNSAPVLALKDLPDDVRRALPALSLGGSIYSDSAANRFLIVNGQLFHENDALTSELTLRQIKLKSAVLEFRGYRYEISY